MPVKIKSLSIVVILSLSVSVGLWGSLSGTGHDFRTRCKFCHLTRPKVGEIGHFTRDISFLCLDCHSVATRNSHPVGMIPTMQVPEDFLLDWGGRLTCATCHDPHADAPDGQLSFMRTDATGKAFCDLCHFGSLPLRGELHVGAVGIAHGKSGIVESHAEYEQILDPITIECLNCHDGVIASDASYQVDGGDALTYKRSGRSHPIGVDYLKASARDDELRPVDSLSADIALYDGKVGCASCHNPYSRIRRMLVVDDAGSTLCFECHVK